ncbi:MAG: TetR/AcrR family transcriptional regulator [Rhodococcus sp. (in: high G+C Gram-positive bacteria)]|uniref:TetR/AcrR family transcriptional regulator n=1 Tax=Rhodococcus sp. TaxID=1831 RepID=UPI003BB2033A
MESEINPRASVDDLTAKARIRNAAMDLYAANGEDRTSMRAVAGAAGVTVGLLVHHFGTKDGIRDAVEQLVVDYFAQAIAQAPHTGTPHEIAAARDASVARMLETHPAVVNYLRRTLLEPGSPHGTLLERLTDLTYSEITKLRNTGIASTRRRDSSQVIGLVVRQVGQLFLQPMIDAMWEQLEGPDAPAEGKPVLSVTVHDTESDTG